MGECIVKAPKYSKYLDYDYIGFSFDGVHCCEDLDIIRTSDSDRYQESMPQLKDKTSHVDGEDYTRMERSFHGPRQFKINFAFDGLTDVKLQNIRQAFMPGKEGGLWFDEAPYKVYDARVSDRVTLSYVPFDGDNGTVYKGTGTVSFVCDYPYAHTPDFVIDKDELVKRDGKQTASYRDSGFKNVDQWKVASGLDEGIGEVPFYFEAIIKDEDEEEGNIVYHEEGDYLIYTYDPELGGYICSGDPTWTNFTETIYSNIEIKQTIEVEGYPQGSVVRVSSNTFDKFYNKFGTLKYDSKGSYLGSEETYVKNGWLIKASTQYTNTALNAIFDDENIIIIGIADKAIYACKKAIDLNLKGVEYVGNKAFEASTNLSTVTFSNNVKYIGSGAFLYCGTKEIVFKDFETQEETNENETYKYDNKFLINKKTNTLTHGLSGSVSSDGSEFSEKIKETGVSKIGAEAFRNRGGSGILKLHEGLIEIGESAFRSTKFTTVQLPSTIKKLDNYAFAQMGSLTTVSTPEGVSEIQLEEIGDQIVNMEALVSFPFDKCLKLKSIGTLGISYSSLTKIDLSKLLQLKTLGYRAFSYSKVLGEIILPKNLESIGGSCFDDSNIESLTIPKSVVFIGAHILDNADSIQTVEMGNPDNWFCKEGGVYKEKTLFAVDDFQEAYSYYNLGDKLYSVKTTSNEILEGEEVQITIDQKEMQLIGVNSDEYKKIFWNSKTGIVSGVKEVSGKNVTEVLPAKGTVYGPLIPAKNIETNYIQDIKYHYWYY